jgi:hypothetical protein
MIFFKITSYNYSLYTWPDGRPGPKPEFWVLTGSSRSIFFNQKNIVLVEKQKLTGCNQIFNLVN